MDIKLKYGLQDGILVDIDAVDSGLACNCLCPACGQRLVAKKGNIKEHHFAHHDTEECKGATETALHIFAKTILEKHRRIVLPDVRLDYFGKVLFESKEVTFDEVLLEKRIDNIVPDIIVYIKGKPLIIEVAVSHFTGSDKRYKIFELGYSAIEINAYSLFNSNYFNISENTNFEKHLIEDTEYKSWINNIKLNRIKDEIKKLGEPKKIVDTNIVGFPSIVHDCPINSQVWKNGIKKGQSYALARYDCDGCRFGELVREQKYFNGGMTVIDGQVLGVSCWGHKQKQIDELILKYNDK